MLDVFIQFLKLGLTSFGGPVAHIGYFQREFVERKAWLKSSEFASLLALCQFLPGPASSQLGFAIGLHRAGIVGAFVAFLAFTLPSVLSLLLLLWVSPYLSETNNQLLLQSFKLLAVVIVADALLSMGQNLCNSWPKRGLAMVVALVLLFSSVGPWPCLIAAAVFGFFVLKESAPKLGGEISHDCYPGLSSKHSWLFAGVFFLLLCVFLVPPRLLGFDQNIPVLWSLASEFYQAGALVFGGGHVVLPLLQSSLLEPGLVTEGEFLTAYGSAQIVPGPMFSIAAYLGAVAGPDSFSVTGAAVALLAIFLPGFLLLLAVLPVWQTLLQQEKLAAAVAAVNAAVVGLLAASFYQPVVVSAVHSIIDVIVVAAGFYLLRFIKLPVICLLPLILFVQVLIG
ncbi:chromate efflux transporter [Pseudoteredinibacter isoporae]|nr:chromate efflux transporter [Pseudoteredinibacter isoporae]NIB24444.1 chromate efflux transporter [Pseudoteredinibacter isoporae]